MNQDIDNNEHFSGSSVVVGSISGNLVSSSITGGVSISAAIDDSVSSSITGGTSISAAIDDIKKTVEALKKRMLVINPDFERHEQYPALKQAYDTYVLLDRMIFDNGDNEE